MNDQAYAETVKKTLLDCITDLDSVKWLFLKHPETDFTRDWKFSFQKLVKIMLLIDGGSLQNELMKYFSFADDTPTKSAFCQQRAKVLPEAIRFLFSTFTERLEALDTPKLFHGYRILAADGSDINIPYNPLDAETFHKNGDNRGYNQLHLNAFYDALNGIYADCVLESDRKSHERAALLPWSIDIDPRSPPSSWLTGDMKATRFSLI